MLAFTIALAIGADSPPRDGLDTIETGSYAPAPAAERSLRILDWNIDRGKHLKGIDAAIGETQPEICIFQEVDQGARRTGGRDVARELARTFEMNYAFAPEFRELSQSYDDSPAYHGQAILSRLPIRGSRILRFAHQSGFWRPHPLLISSLPILQRREGGRIALISELEHNGGIIAVYNLHLESRGTEYGRLLQLQEVLADAQRYSNETPVVIAGDLNTKSRHSPLITTLNQAGYRSCFDDRRVRTHILMGALDWIFFRGAVECQSAEVRRDFHASDHFAISAQLRF